METIFTRLASAFTASMITLGCSQDAATQTAPPKGKYDLVLYVGTMAEEKRRELPSLEACFDRAKVVAWNQQGGGTHFYNTFDAECRSNRKPDTAFKIRCDVNNFDDVCRFVK